MKAPVAVMVLLSTFGLKGKYMSEVERGILSELTGEAIKCA
jgi:hypothetical protein